MGWGRPRFNVSPSPPAGERGFEQGSPFSPEVQLQTITLPPSPANQPCKGDAGRYTSHGQLAGNDCLVFPGFHHPPVLEEFSEFWHKRGVHCTLPGSQEGFTHRESSWYNCLSCPHLGVYAGRTALDNTRGTIGPCWKEATKGMLSNDHIPFQKAPLSFYPLTITRSPGHSVMSP